MSGGDEEAEGGDIILIAAAHKYTLHCAVVDEMLDVFSSVLVVGLIVIVSRRNSIIIIAALVQKFAVSLSKHARESRVSFCRLTVSI